MQQPPHGYGPPPGYPAQGGYGPPPGYPPPGYGPPPPKKGIGVLGWIGILTLLCFGGCFGMCALGAAGAKKASDDAAEKKKSDDKAFDDEKAMKVTAAELAAAYDENEVKADEKYKGHKVEVTGVVSGIDSSIGDEPVVRLKGKSFDSVMAHDVPKRDAADLKKGETVTLVCKADGEVIGSPVLRNCSVK